MTVLFKHPTLGAHPDKLEWFHCTRIHTIADWLLGIPENKAMNTDSDAATAKKAISKKVVDEHSDGFLLDTGGLFFIKLEEDKRD